MFLIHFLQKISRNQQEDQINQWFREQCAHDLRQKRKVRKCWEKIKDFHRLLIEEMEGSQEML